MPRRRPFRRMHCIRTCWSTIWSINPVETVLLNEARERGCRVLTGVKMLVYQGAAAFERWTGVWPPTDVMEAAVLEGMNPLARLGARVL